MGENPDPRRNKDNLSTIRRIDGINLLPGKGLLDPDLDPAFEPFRFYELHVESKGFLYQQIRRMTAAIVGGAQGKVVVVQHKIT